MPSMTPSQARANIDPILTDHVQRYVPQEYGWTELSPITPVSALSGRVIQFDKSDFSDYETAKGVGEDAKERSFFYSDGNYSLAKHEIHGKVPLEVLEQIDAQQIPINMQERAATGSYEAIRRRTAREVAALVTNAGNYAAANKVALSGTDKFGGTTSQLLAIADSAIDIIDLNTDRRPNLAVISLDAFLAATNDPLFKEQVKHTQSPLTLGGMERNAEILASLWKIDRVVVDRMKVKTQSTVERVGSGCVVFAYVDPQQDLFQPSFAKTYQHEDFPIVGESYQDNKSGAFYFPVATYHSVVLTAPSAGYLVTGCV
jgi:hypothetical protein